MEDTVMAIAPHPDDLEIGMGGTIAALVNSGKRVIMVDLTNGEPTPFGTPEKRAIETSAATKILRVKDRVMLDIPNREIFDTVENRKKVATLIREYQPKVLFIPYWEDAHPDHSQASQLCDAARFYAKLVKTDMPFEPHYPRRIFYYFSTHLRPRFSPSFIFDISETFDTKLEALRAYKSQFSENPKNVGVFDALRVENSYWGFQVGSKFGEPFVCRESLRISRSESLLNL